MSTKEELIIKQLKEIIDRTTEDYFLNLSDEEKLILLKSETNENYKNFIIKTLEQQREKERNEEESYRRW